MEELGQSDVDVMPLKVRALVKVGVALLHPVEEWTPLFLSACAGARGNNKV